MSRAMEVRRALEPAYRKGDEFAIKAVESLNMAATAPEPTRADFEDRAADEILFQLYPFVDPEMPPTGMTYVARVTFSCLVDEGIHHLEDFVNHPSNHKIDE